jgi:signal transduction histidine kinase
MGGERKRRSERSAEDELRARTMFFAEVEHKVKTALSILQGWAVTLDERWDVMSPDARREGIAIVRRAADTLVAQADGMLEEARAELHSLDLVPDVLDLGEVLQVTAGGHRSPSHTIVVDIPIPVRVRVDPGALQQILGHLIENAVKYSPSGGEITLRAGVGVGVAILEISDQGIGLPEEGTDLIFEPFHRGGGPSGVSKPGVGLGLYIVRKLVEAMGGSITAQGKPGEGSTFTVRLPLA